MSDILTYAAKVIIVFLFTYFGARFLSKKAIAQMTSYEIAGVILLSNIAAEPLVTKVLVKSILGTGLMIAIITITARLALINKLTPIFEHSPSIVIKNSQVETAALHKNSLSLNQLMGLMRQSGFDKVSDVEFAVFEPQGNLSVFPNSQNRPLQPRDMQISTQYEGLTLPLIMDGRIIHDNLIHIGLTEKWLLNSLKFQQIHNYEQEVTLAELDTMGNLKVSRK